MVTLGVTGGLGSGKSTACRYLQEKGAYVFGADIIAKEILSNNEEIQFQILDAFGNTVAEEGKIDHQKLARIAFASEENQTILNDIVHPFVIAAFEQELLKIGNQEGLFVVDAPLLFESGFDSHLDHTLLVYTKYKIRLGRAMRRGNLDREDILRRMSLQMPEEEKRELASYVIENNGAEDQLRDAVFALYDKLLG